MKYLIILFSFSFSIAHASFDSEFVDSFESGYKPSKCGPNITNFIKRLKGADENVSNSKVLTISNKGFSLFLLINAEYGRRTVLNANGELQEPGQQNWYHHVILENEGMIYDFDFGNTPEILSVKDYFEKMFLNESENNTHPAHKVGREIKLKDYEIKVFSANDLLLNPKVSPEKIMRLGEYLKAY